MNKEREAKEFGCMWRENPDDDGESWLTDCEKQIWDIDPEIGSETFNFCPYCGKKFLM